MQKKFWTWSIIILRSLGALVGASVFIIHTLFNEDSPLQTKGEKAITNSNVNDENITDEDIDEEQVNTPVAEEVVMMSDGTSGHAFISKWHNFYNNSLGWGKIETASYDEQKEAAESILSELKDVKVTDEQIAEDLKDIETNAQALTEADDQNLMLHLHRYFHDLDIYFNGYSYDQTFGITEFRGN